MDGRRILDIVLGATALTLALPVVALAGLAVKLASPGPAFYRATRAGIGGKPFTMLKLRTMNVARDTGSPITAGSDSRVFRLGSWLRNSKVDELPQLWSVVCGDMALVGPRPEDPGIVSQHYGPAERATLTVRPGLTSPGTIYYYTHEESGLDPLDPVGSYIPVMRHKLAMDAAYSQEASVLSDLHVIWATVRLIVRRVLRSDTSATPTSNPGDRSESEE
jgi:lipopolysaccharide/colanic/teichoic acid biosynthesis glycosyltransferase